MTRTITFDPNGWEDYVYWQTHDSNALKPCSSLANTIGGQVVISTSFVRRGESASASRPVSSRPTRRIGSDGFWSIDRHCRVPPSGRTRCSDPHPADATASRMRTRLWSAITGTGPHRGAAVGLLTEGTFGPPGFFPQFRLLRERPLSWVGVLVREETVELWKLRPLNGRPLDPDGAPQRMVTLGGTSGVPADLRINADRRFPILWIRWTHEGQLACAGFAPIREDTFGRTALDNSRFDALATALAQIIPLRDS